MRGRWLKHDLFVQRLVYPTTKIDGFLSFNPTWILMYFFVYCFIMVPVYDQTCMNQLWKEALRGAYTNSGIFSAMFALQRTLMEMTVRHPVSFHCLWNKIQFTHFFLGSLKHKHQTSHWQPPSQANWQRGACCKSFHPSPAHHWVWNLDLLEVLGWTIYQCWADILTGYHLGYHL